MAKKLDIQDYRSHLAEQIDFLQTSAQLYDQGKEIEAKRMAISMRTLVHDTQQTKSLLGQMSLKKKMKFISTSYPFSETNLLTQQCLLHMNLGPNGGTFIPAYDGNKHRCLSFPEWNSERILSDRKRKPYNRRDVMILLANKDGGAHVDAEISDELSELKEKDFTGWIMSSEDGKTQSMNNSAVYASMRQITFELLQSLYLVKPQLFSIRYF